jgi:hypothetical protein
MEKVASSSVDIACDHEPNSYSHCAGEQVNRQEV